MRRGILVRAVTKRLSGIASMFEQFCECCAMINMPNPVRDSTENIPIAWSSLCSLLLVLNLSPAIFFAALLSTYLPRARTSHCGALLRLTVTLFSFLLVASSEKKKSEVFLDRERSERVKRNRVKFNADY